MNKIYLHIDRLVLEGFTEDGQGQYVQGLQQGLQTMLERTGSVDLLRTAGSLNQLKIQSTALNQKSDFKKQGFSTASQIVNGLQKQ